MTNDRDPEISARATFALYRLGDVDDHALGIMRRWIETGARYLHGEGGYGWSQYLDVRAFALHELSYYRDTRLNDVIYATWKAGLAHESETVGYVDYGYWLETNGYKLPGDYWRSRLDFLNGVENTLAILQTKRPDGFLNDLKSFFDAHHAVRPTNVYADRSARVSAVLYNETGNEVYLRYLLGAAAPEIARSQSGGRLQLLLPLLAATNNNEALAMIGAVLNNPNDGRKNTAVSALAYASSPVALQMLTTEAERYARATQLFPAAALKSVLAQRTPAADAAYDQLKTALMDGRFGEPRRAGEFEALEFFRKNR